MVTLSTVLASRSLGDIFQPPTLFRIRPPEFLSSSPGGKEFRLSSSAHALLTSSFRHLPGASACLPEEEAVFSYKFFTSVKEPILSWAFGSLRFSPGETRKKASPLLSILFALCNRALRLFLFTDQHLPQVGADLSDLSNRPSQPAISEV